MKRIFLLSLLICLSCICFCQKTPKAVFIIADGIPSDVIEKLDLPNLASIRKAGGYARAFVGGEKGGYSQTPTISAVGYNSLLTGTWVNKHNVWGNDIKAPNYNYWNLFRLLKAAYPQKKTAVFSTWKENRTLLVGSDVAAAGYCQPDYFVDGLELDTLRFPHDKNSGYIHLIDELVTDSAATIISRNAPDLSWVYLEFTDDMGHRYGDSENFYNAIKTMDAQVGRIWAAIQEREKNYPEEWQIYITTDHGRHASNGKDHGGQSDRERATWIFTNAKELNTYFRNDLPGIVDILPTIARFFRISIPKDKLMELDGVSLTGPLSATHLEVIPEKDKLLLKWNVLDGSGKARIWITTTNHFAIGEKDNYELAGEINEGAGGFSIDTQKWKSSFYKVVVEFPHNYLNRWVRL